MATKRKTYKQTPEARARSNKRRTVLAIKRYWYVRKVLGAPAWKARMARESVLTLRLMFPEHQFPEDIIQRSKPGPAKGTPSPLKKVSNG